MPLKELAFFADVKRKVAKTNGHTITVPKLMENYYTSPCLFIVFENFRICFILHAKIKVFFINVKVT